MDQHPRTTAANPFLGYGDDRSRDDLARYGYELIRKFSRQEGGPAEPPTEAYALPDGVCVIEQSRGGDRIFVAFDWSILIVGSAEPTSRALQRWEAGERTATDLLPVPSPAKEHEQYDLTEAERSLGARGSKLIRRVSKHRSVHMVSREIGIGVLVAEPLKGGRAVLVGADGGYLFLASYESEKMAAERYRTGARR